MSFRLGFNFLCLLLSSRSVMNFIFSREAFFKSGSFRSSSFKKCKMHQDKLLYFALKITYHWILLCKSVILINKDLVSGMKWMVFPVWRVLPGFVLLLCWSVSPSLWLDACSYSTATTSMYTLVSREKWNTTWAALTTTVRQPLKPALESLFQEENQEREFADVQKHHVLSPKCARQTFVVFVMYYSVGYKAKFAQWFIAFLFVCWLQTLC